MLMGRGFPQLHQFSNLLVVSPEPDPIQTGRQFPPYPHLGITLWITQIASDKGFSAVVLTFLSKSNMLDEEAPCG